MDITSPNSAKIGPLARASQWLVAIPRRLSTSIMDFLMMAKKLGEDDPRRIAHAFKVALAISIVSLFYYLQPLYNGFRSSTMWAVLTVVVVFEFFVGATLGKGINRMIATLLAGFLGVLAHHLADHSGKIGEPILLAIFGFIVATIVTFLRFLPRLKARYDYGLMIFILTFLLLSESSYRSSGVIEIAYQRLSTVMIGCLISMLVCICIFPVWCGAELHNLIASNINKLSCYLEVFGGEYFSVSDEEKARHDKSFLHLYKSILSSKGTEEKNMANLAAWEPGHGQFKFRHPWKQYLKIGTLTRKCAYRIDVLNIYVQSDVQASQEIKQKIQDACSKLSSESSKALKELSLEMKKMRRSSSTNAHIQQSKSMAQELESLIGAVTVWEEFNLLDILPVATVASSLIEIVACIEEIAEAVQELATLANFKTIDSVVAPEKAEVVEVLEAVIGNPHPDVSGPLEQLDHAVLITINGGPS